MSRAGLAVVVQGAVLVLAACSVQPAPCSAADAVMAAHAIECAARVRAECADVPDDECPAIKECDEWGEQRCGFGGAAGAK